MADPIIAIGGQDGEYVEKWQSKEERRIQTIQRKQKKELEHQLTLASQRKPFDVGRGGPQWTEVSYASMDNERSVIMEYKSMMAEREELLRTELEDKEEYKDYLLSELQLRRQEYEHAKGDRLRDLQARAQEKLKQQLTELEQRRYEWEYRQISVALAQAQATEARDASMKESCQKLKEHQTNTLNTWKKNQEQSMKDVMTKETERETQREAQLAALKEHQRQQAEAKKRQRNERQKRLMQTLAQVEDEDGNKRERYRQMLAEKEAKAMMMADEDRADRAVSAQERDNWMNYMNKRINHSQKVDAGWRGYVAEKTDRGILGAEEVQKRKEAIRKHNRDQHIYQSSLYGTVKESFNQEHRGIISGTIQKVTLPDVKLRPAPALHPMKDCAKATMPQIGFSTSRPSLPARTSFKTALKAGQKIVGEGATSLLRATM